MKIIHKIAAVVIKDDAFLMVRKKGKDVWTSLGGHPEEGETEEQALLREIKEEMGCEATIVQLSTYLVELSGTVVFEDPELEEYKYIGKNWKDEGIKVPASISEQVLPYCIKERLLNW
jgi:8-oxo-dGTP pyrophosphatase MutT (NUDIX family)